MEFKVGDWVHLHFKSIGTEPNYADCIEQIGGICNGDYYYNSECSEGSRISELPGNTGDWTVTKLWIPKEGEWCWLNNNNHLQKSFPSLRLIKYHKTFLPDFNNGIIEPFIGTLPSFIKDK